MSRKERRAPVALFACVVASALSDGCSSPAPARNSGAPAPSSTEPSTVAEPSDARDAGVEDSSSSACPVVGPGTVAGTVTHPPLLEASGLTASARSPGVLWTHNDSGDSARIFALNADATLAAEIEIAGASAIDWEAIAAGPFEGDPALYIGDIGDNARARANVTIYVVAEPALDPAPQSVPVVKRLDLTYEDGPNDAEALLVDPDDGTVVIATKSFDGKSKIYTADLARSRLVHETTLEKLPLVTDGSVSKDGRLVALRTYGTAFVWPRSPGTSIVDALAHGVRCPLSLESERQGEAITFASDGRSYLTLSEGKGQPLWSFPLAPPARR